MLTLRLRGEGGGGAQFLLVAKRFLRGGINARCALDLDIPVRAEQMQALGLQSVE
jgi:hypothetical protein